MKKLFKKTLILGLLSCTTVSGSVLAEEQPTQQITRSDEHLVHQAPGENFTGAAHFSRFPTMPSSGDVVPATVTFAPNTITNWHIHPAGQYLIIIEGQGRTQEWGKPIQPLHKGDVVWCPPGVKHWHGASVHNGMTHIAISPVPKDDEKVTWLEKVELPKEEIAEQKSQKKVTAPVVLNKKQLSLIPIAAFSTKGDIERLTPALVKGLESGLSVNEIKEVFSHQYAYAGFPRSLNGMLTFKSLLEQRQRQGIQDVPGAVPSSLPSDTDYYQRGNETLAFLNKTSLEQSSKPLFDNFSPTIDHALKAHLFGYLFSRDNFGYLERELVVVSTLAALGDVNAQLTSHLRITRNLGVDNTQMQRIMKTLEHEVDPMVARNAQQVLQQLK